LKGKQAELRVAASFKFEEVLPGVRKVLLWGNDSKGPYGAITKFAPDHKNPLHTHAHDIRLVVLQGAYLYTGPDGKTTRLGPGSYAMIPGGHEHVSAGDPTMETVFLEVGSGRFSLDMVRPR
jgi:quercetin dioxygenase-like cupin family protein